MTTTRLGTVLSALALVPAAMLSVQPANAQADTDLGTYCTSPSIQNMYPTCAPPPAPTTDYRGEPVAVFDQKKFNPGTVRASINVLKNDAVQKKTKIKAIKITYRRPEQTGVRTWIDRKNKIWFESLPGRNDGSLPLGTTEIRYKVIDAKGRTSHETNVYLKVDYKPCAYTNTCS